MYFNGRPNAGWLHIRAGEGGTEEAKQKVAAKSKKVGMLNRGINTMSQ